ncbi:alpha/beta fold hydrolase [Nocardia sp. NPDC052566]|uniref:alpha/beta fold hydrolase n=1 Tax=Nocardia sp. NPDC052566 TaxID=3364330 RepID=UPI0037C5A911
MTSIRVRATAFLDDCASRELVAGQHHWRYFRGGEGDPVLLLSGGAGIGISWLDLTPALLPHHRVLAPDYPATVARTAELVDGLVAMLDAEGVERAHVVGQSAGGMYAELLSRRVPERIRSLTLTSTGLYGPADVDRLRMRVDTTLATPWEQTREAVRTALRAAWQHSEDAEFWIEQVEAATAAGGREGSANSYRLLLEIARGVEELLSEPAWPGPTLLVKAEDDPLITTTHTDRLRTAHPAAEFRSFPDGGHSLLLSRPADYIAAVTEFLSRT